MSFGMPDIYWIDSFEYPTDEILNNSWTTEKEVEWTPEEISTALWLDASASGTITLDGSGNVEQWDDKSGNDNHFSQATASYRPEIGTNGGISQNSTTSYKFLASNPTVNGLYAVVIVSKWYSTAGDYRHFCIAHGGTASSGDLFSTSYGGQLVQDGDGWITGVETSPKDMNRYTTPVIHFFVPSGEAGMGYQTGNGGGFPQRCFYGEHYEIIGLSTAPSTDERQKIEGYLAHKWGLDADLPSDHPYKTSKPMAQSSLVDIYTDNSSPTYGNFSLRAEATISGSKTYGFEKEFTQNIGLKDYNSLSFDTKSNRVGENVEFNMTVNGPPDIDAITNWLDDWTYRIPITIDHTKIDEDLTHFPIPITISGTTASGIFDEIGENNKKIAIATEEKIQLYGEIEQWDSSTSKICIWTSKSDFVVSSGTDTNLYFYYDSSKDDNIDYIGSAGDTSAQNVWDSNFISVYTMSQDPSVGGACILDSTSNENHGTPNGSMTSEDLVNGYIGKAITFDGTDDYIDYGNLIDLGDNNLVGTLEIVTSNTNTAGMSIIGAERTSSSLGAAQLRLSNDFNLQYYRIDLDSHPYASYITTSNYINGYSNYMCFSSKGANDRILCLNDSIEYSNFGFNYSRVVQNNIEVGRNRNYTYSTVFRNYIVDHIRVSNTSRSASWIKATNSSLKNNINSIGYEESIHTSISKTIHHNDINTWQKEIVDFSSLFDTSLFYIRKIAFNILNDDLDNIFYIDNMYLSNFQPPIDEPVIIKSLSLSIDHTKIDEDLNNFPLMISLVSGTCDIFDQLVENNLKFKIETEDGTQCYTEIEDWNYSNGKACLWTKVPTVSSSVDTKLTLTYSSSFDDNIYYIGTTGSGVSYNVWNDNFVAVYHMNQDPSGGTDCIIDSTINENHGTPAGSMTSDDLVDIDYGKAIDFDGSNDSIYSSFSLPEPLTVIIDIKPDSTSAFVPFCVNWDYTQDQGRLLKWDAGWKVYSGNDNNTFGGSISVGNWYRIVFTVNSSNLIEIFQNGTSLGTATRTNSGENTNNYFGSEKSLQNFFNGKISNIMCANNVLQNAWIKADYYNTINNLITIT
jgi:hypothetical protein